MNENEKQDRLETIDSDTARMERLVGSAEANARGNRRRTFKGSGTGKAADREVNRQLTARRALMEKRVKRGRVTLWVFAALSLVEIGLQIFTSLRLPVSCALTDLLTVYGLISIPCLIGAFLPIVYMAVLAIRFRKDNMEFWRKSLIVFVWIDLILIIMFGGRIYGLEDSYITPEMISNLILHIPMIWFMMRAVRAMGALDILPTEEMEGDPYAGFGENVDSSEDGERRK